MDWLVIAVQWLHVFFGIFWFGSILFGNFVLGPVLMKMDAGVLRNVMVPLGRQADRVVLPVAIAAIVLGVIRGTVFGPVRSLEFLLGTAYGITFLVGLIAALGTFAWSRYYTSEARREFERGVDIRSSTGKAVRNAGIEMFGFAVIFTCMILMRFGL